MPFLILYMTNYIDIINNYIYYLKGKINNICFVKNNVNKIFLY